MQIITPNDGNSAAARHRHLVIKDPRDGHKRAARQSIDQLPTLARDDQSSVWEPADQRLAHDPAS
ncbi:MAG: hypothetical protein ACXVII_37525, partial [Solirubrobacteraceae bacterium]